MYVTRVSRYMTLHIASVLSAVFCNHGRSWNMLPVATAVYLYTVFLLKNSTNDCDYFQKYYPAHSKITLHCITEQVSHFVTSLLKQNVMLNVKPH